MKKIPIFSGLILGGIAGLGLVLTLFFGLKECRPLKDAVEKAICNTAHKWQWISK